VIHPTISMAATTMMPPAIPAPMARPSFMIARSVY
jgi:hypothetical protein